MGIGKLKDYPNEVRQFPPGQPLSELGGHLGGILYAANPVYIELSQGGTSPFRGMYAFMGLLIVAASLFAIAQMEPSTWKLDWGGFSEFLFLLLFLFFIVTSLSFAILNLIGPSDEVIRFDRKRKVLYKRCSKAGDVIEIPWSRLTPELRSWAHSAYFPGRHHQGMFIEYGEDGKPRETNGVQHAVAIGGPTGHEITPLMMMEAVRQFMEKGYNSAIRPEPEQWAYHDDMTWRVLFSLINDEKGASTRLKESYEDELHGGVSLGFSHEDVRERLRDNRRSEWMSISLSLLAGPILYPMFVLNLPIAAFAARPKWSPALLAQHEADLAQIKVNAYGYPTDLLSAPSKGGRIKQERKRKQEIQERKEQERQQSMKDYRHYARLEFWAGITATSLALGSSTILVLMGFVDVTPDTFFHLVGLAWLMSAIAIFIHLLTTPWAQKTRAARALAAQ
jgi:hypothetical protein